jgi:hypothetical protein
MDRVVIRRTISGSKRQTRRTFLVTVVSSDMSAAIPASAAICSQVVSSLMGPESPATRMG